jgi:hypothetical protein
MAALGSSLSTPSELYSSISPDNPVDPSSTPELNEFINLSQGAARGLWRRKS